MRSPLNRIRGALNYGHDYIVSTASFPQLNLPKIREQLQLDKKGTEHGQQNLPPGDATSVDGVEQSIITYVESERNAANERYLDHLRTYAERIQILDIEGRHWEIEKTVRESISNFALQVRQGLDELFEARRHLLATDAQVADFREEHQLRRLPKSRPSRVLLWGIVLLLFLVEVALNGTFLARGNEAGLVGGIGVAAVVALLNIFFLGLTAGRLFVPQLHHRSAWRKIVGAVLLLGYVAAMLTLNLAVAHYRDALNVNLEDAAQIGWANFLANPLGISDIQSWMLFALGASFSLIAVFDGLKFDDPYPGYGEVERQRLDAVDDYVETKNEKLDDLERHKDATIEQLEKARENISRRRTEYFSIIDARLRLRRSFSEHLSHLESSANNLLGIYRGANREARTAPAPEHFQHPYQLPRPDEVPFSDEMSPATVEEQVEKATSRLTAAIQEVFDKYDEAMTNYRRIDELQEVPDVTPTA